MFIVPMRKELKDPAAADMIYRFVANVTSTMRLESRLRTINPIIRKR